MKALVTGCAGFIGSSLVDYLLKCGYDVVGIDCFTNYYARGIKEKNIECSLMDDNFRFIEKDINIIENFPYVDIVFHLAAQAGVRSSWGENFHVYINNNIKASQRLLEFYKDFKLKKFVYSSSSSVYGDSSLPMNENSLLKPLSPYGVTKLAAENLCYLYWKNYKVPTVSLRYFTVYGPRQRPDMAINKFIRSIYNNKEILIYGDGEQTRDFTYIDDVIKANLLAAETDVVGEVFNVGGGSRISVNKLISVMESLTGKKAVKRYVNRQAGDVKDTWADLDKVTTLLGWKPKVDIFDGLKKYIEYMESNFR